MVCATAIFSAILGVASGEVQVPANVDPRAERQVLLQIASRPIDNAPTYTVGAEVSRFQRSTVPSRPRGENNNNAGRQASSGIPAAPSQPMGPVVRIARGNNVTVVPVGGR